MANRCKELGCVACCEEACITQTIPVDDDTFHKLFPEGSSKVLVVEATNFPGYAITSKAYRDEVDAIVAPINNPRDGALFWLIQLTAACPQLAESGECGIYEDRPISCRLFPNGGVIGGDGCNNLRRARKLPPLQSE